MPEHTSVYNGPSFIRHYFADSYLKSSKNTRKTTRALASLTAPGGQELHFPNFFLKFRSIFLIFPQTLLIFFLILAFRVGESPTREGPGYATENHHLYCHFPHLKVPVKSGDLLGMYHSKQGGRTCFGVIWIFAKFLIGLHEFCKSFFFFFFFEIWTAHILCFYIW